MYWRQNKNVMTFFSDFPEGHSRHAIAVISFFVVFTLFKLPLLSCTTAHAEKNNTNNSNGIGIMLTNDKGKILFSENPDQKFIPASTLKILTSLEALHFLGKNFRFKTVFFLDKQFNLKIKGYGDPFFTSEVIKAICKRLFLILQQKKIFKINSIILDDTFFASPLNIPGTGESSNPYDASVGALCANFNTVFFTHDRAREKIISAEPQTPILPFTEKRIKASGLHQGRIILSKNESRIYAGLLIKYFLKLQGIHLACDTSQVGNSKIKQDCGIKTGSVSAEDEKILTWKSPYTLKDIIQKLLRYSNNFTANQIFLRTGAERCASPASLYKGVNTLKNYAENNLGIKKIEIAEGSGLSRKNRITPREMIKLLFAFMPYHDLMRKKYTENKIKLEEFYKTGTLKDVRTRAGYFRINNGRLYPYVIMVNNKKCSYELIKNKLEKIVTKDAE